MLVHEGGWTPEQYQRWLADTMLTAFVDGEVAKGYVKVDERDS
jgi:hypothetical protein